MTVAPGSGSRAQSIEEVEAGPGTVLLAGGTEVVPQLEDGLLEAETLVGITGLLPRGISRSRIGAGATLAELEERTRSPRVREACRLAASPQLRNMATVGGNLLQSTRCWYWRLQYPCRLHGATAASARGGTSRARDLRERLLRLGAPVGPRGGAARARCTVQTNRRELPPAHLYRVPETGDVRLVTLGEGEVLLELELPPCDASVYLKAMDRKRFGFPLVGVAAVRRGETTGVALAGGHRPRGFSTARSMRQLRFRAPHASSRWPGRWCHARSLPSKLDEAPRHLRPSRRPPARPARPPAAGRQEDLHDDDHRRTAVSSSNRAGLRGAKRKQAEGAAPDDKTYEITMVTNCGSFTFRIDQEESPNAAASVVTLVQRGFFNNTIFHRIVPGFVIQGGDPTGRGRRRPRLHDDRQAPYVREVHPRRGGDGQDRRAAGRSRRQPVLHR